MLDGYPYPYPVPKRLSWSFLEALASMCSRWLTPTLVWIARAQRRMGTGAACSLVAVDPARGIGSRGGWGRASPAGWTPGGEAALSPPLQGHERAAAGGGLVASRAHARLLKD